MKNKLLVSLLCATAICSTAFATEGTAYLPISSKKSRGGLEFVERKDAEEAFQRLHSYVGLLHYKLDKAFERIKVLEDVTFKGDRNARKEVKAKLGFETNGAQALGQRSRTSSIDLQDIGGDLGESEGATKKEYSEEEKLGAAKRIQSNYRGFKVRNVTLPQAKLDKLDYEDYIALRIATDKRERSLAKKGTEEGALSAQIERAFEEKLQNQPNLLAVHKKIKAREAAVLQDEGRDRPGLSRESSISDVDSSRTFVATSVRSQNAPNFVPPPPPARVSQRTSSALDIPSLSLEESLKTDSGTGSIAGAGITPRTPLTDAKIEEKYEEVLVAKLRSALQSNPRKRALVATDKSNKAIIDGVKSDAVAGSAYTAALKEIRKTL